jgi:hypothetical protein
MRCMDVGKARRAKRASNVLAQDIGTGTNSERQRDIGHQEQPGRSLKSW